MFKVIMAMVGVVLGQGFAEEPGAIAGALAGLLLGWLVDLQRRIAALERKLAGEGESRPPAVREQRREVPDGVAAAASSAEASTLSFETAEHAAPPPHPQAPKAVELDWSLNDVPPPRGSGWSESEPAGPAHGTRGPVTAWLHRFFTTGNLVVKIGVLILFFGVAFLLKYASDNALLPPEARLAGAMLGGVALLVAGWRLRNRVVAYALVLQGGGVGVMYLSLFAAAKIFHLAPLGLVFALMVALVIFSGLLAVLQNARSLAFFGMVGGFLAPVLTSTGSGSHVMLFTYYALLNAGILGIAWHRSWRELNVVGFLFTFAIASAWGWRSYTPAHFATTEPFLVLFFVFYVVIAVLFAHRQPPRLKGYVDTMLVFGVPIAAAGLQSQVIAHIEYGLAFSALGAGAFYVVLASVLWRRDVAGMRLLCEVFVALGLVFLSLAIPLAFDPEVTTAAWALEGAAMVWVGLRQQRWLLRSFGLLLQVGSVPFFLQGADSGRSDPLLLNAEYIGGLMISLAGLASSYLLSRTVSALRAWEQWHAPLLLAWGLLWWVGIGVNEIDERLRGFDHTLALVAYLALSTALLTTLCQRLPWALLAWPLGGWIPLLLLLSLVGYADRPLVAALGGWGWLVWPLAGAVQYAVLRRIASHWPVRWQGYAHTLALLQTLFLLGWSLAAWSDALSQGAEGWRMAAWGAIAALGLLALVRWRDCAVWPIGPHRAAYLGLGGSLIAMALVLWNLAAMTLPGPDRPLAYWPLVNPLELAQLLGGLALAFWWRRRPHEPIPGLGEPPSWLGAAVLGGLGFLLLNVLLARLVHDQYGVAYRFGPLWRFTLLQTGFSILWTTTALVTMIAAHRFRLRAVWLGGGGLLALVVVKLFTVDLAGSGTVERIVSFLVVGALMLVVGYFSPLPPRAAKEAT